MSQLNPELTVQVLENNEVAKAFYKSLGFGPYMVSQSLADFCFLFLFHSLNKIFFYFFAAVRGSRDRSVLEKGA